MIIFLPRNLFFLNVLKLIVDKILSFSIVTIIIRKTEKKKKIGSPDRRRFSAEILLWASG